MTNPSKPIFLIGMPGSGKTYWGEKISKELNIPVLDTDQEIERNEQLSIAEIFTQKSEDYFRKKENTLLQSIISQSNNTLLVCTGGGLPYYHNNMQLMNEHGTTIYLNASIDTLVANLSNGFEIRPLLQEHEDALRERLSSILSDRKPIYEQAHHTFAVENLNLEVLEPILKKHV